MIENLEEMLNLTEGYTKFSFNLPITRIIGGIYVCM